MLFWKYIFLKKYIIERHLFESASSKNLILKNTYFLKKLMFEKTNLLDTCHFEQFCFFVLMYLSIVSLKIWFERTHLKMWQFLIEISKNWYLKKLAISVSTLYIDYMVYILLYIITYTLCSYGYIYVYTYIQCCVVSIFQYISVTTSYMPNIQRIIDSPLAVSLDHMSNFRPTWDQLEINMMTKNKQSLSLADLARYVMAFFTMPGRFGHYGICHTLRPTWGELEPTWGSTSWGI